MKAKKKSPQRGTGRIIVVSNRLPITLSRERDRIEVEKSVGGLVSAIEPLYATHNLTWIGAVGSPLKGVSLSRLLRDHRKRYRYVGVDLERRTWESYYNGFANRALWPLFHYFVNFCVFDNREWQAYREVNETFAEKVLKTAKRGDLVWVHDFHLMLVPRILRDARPDLQIGFFLHTPFPSSEVFRILPWRKEILQGLLGADLIGFHAYDYLRHFRSSLLRVLGLESEMNLVHYQGRHITMDVIPVGADARLIGKMLQSRKVREGLTRLKQNTKRIKVLLGVDRLDYTKGLLERFLAYELFLAERPDWRGRVEFFQVLVPSRMEVPNYAELKEKIDALVGRINAEYSTPRWTPIRCFYHPMAMEELIQYYARADVAVVTPLRDGMNLVAKEYLLAQRGKDSGVLLLSEFCGAASELSDAIIVNPSNTRELAQAFREALEMPKAEVTRRYLAMLERLKEFSAQNWGARFIEMLKRSKDHPRRLTPLLADPARSRLKRDWSRSRRRLVFLDYDGTLTDLVGSPERAIPSDETRRLIRRFTRDPLNLVVIVSGRPRSTIYQWLAPTGAYLSAEHGAWIFDREKWHRTYKKTEESHWKERIRPLVELYASRTPGSFIEEKEDALAWHYRMCDPDYGAWQARDLVMNLDELVRGLPVTYVRGKKVVEVRHRDVQKGLTWTWLQKNRGTFDFILALGDDRTDEDLFKALPRKAWTVHVGADESSAHYRLSSPRDVRSFLIYLSSSRVQPR